MRKFFIFIACICALFILAIGHAFAAATEANTWVIVKGHASTSVTVTASVTATSGNLETAIVAGHISSGTVCPSLSVPSGWTLRGTSSCSSASANGSEIWTLTHVAGSSDTSYSFTLTSAAGTIYAGGIVVESSGANTSSPIDQIAYANCTASTSISAPAITTTQSGDLLISAWADSTQAVTGVSSGWSLVTNGAYAEYLDLAYKAQASAGSNGAIAATFGANPDYPQCLSLAIAPAPSVVLHSGLSAAHAGGPHASVVVARSQVSVPSHVMTAIYTDLDSTSEAADPTTYAPYVTFNYPLASHMLASYNAGLRNIQYVNLVMPQSNGGGTEREYTDLVNSYPGLEDTDCSGNKITVYSNTGYLVDVPNAQYGSYVSTVLNDYYTNVFAPYSASKDWEIFFVDNSGILYNTSGSPCDFGSTASWGDNLVSALALQTTNSPHFVMNALSASDANQSTLINHYIEGSNQTGGMFELCFNVSTAQWEAAEDSQIQTVALYHSQSRSPYFGPGWWCYVDGGGLFSSSMDGASSTAIGWRMFVYASFLLTYDPSYSTFQEAFSTTGGIKVFPETGLVPENPVVAYSSLSTYASLACGSLYCREYNDCYYRGTDEGPCYVVVNPSATNTYAIPSNPYTHAAVLSGDGILDGGTMTFGAAAPTSLGPNSAAILFQ